MEGFVREGMKEWGNWLKTPGSFSWFQRLTVQLPHTCCPTVPLHLQPVASLRISHAELVIDSKGCLPVVFQVYTELILSLGCDFAQVIQPCG
jgi:hypothetical protein